MNHNELPVRHAADVSYRDFVRDHMNPRRPVVLKGALDHLPAGGWTPESLKARFADKVFKIDGEDVRFGDFVDRVVNATPDNPPPYLRNIGVDPDFRELSPDLEPGLAYTRGNWRFNSLLPDWWFEAKAGLCQFFFTGPGRGFPFMHVDYPPLHTFSALSYGRKEWLLYAPDQEPYLYPGSRGEGWPVISQVENPFEPDLDKYPDFAKASGIRVMQEAGDLIFVPSGWWHTTRSHTPTIAVAWDHLSASCWKRVSDYKLGAPGFQEKNPVKKALVKSYLGLVATGLKTRDSLAATFAPDAKSGRIA
ncbi:MAG: cupin-like domain-containing protein [Gemmatimonadota bacterium]